MKTVRINLTGRDGSTAVDPWDAEPGEYVSATIARRLLAACEKAVWALKRGENFVANKALTAAIAAAREGEG